MNAMNSQGVTPLHDAVVKKNHEAVTELVLQGADISIKATDG